MGRYNFSYTKRLELALFGAIKRHIINQYPADTDEDYINFMTSLTMGEVLDWDAEPYIFLEKDFIKGREEVRKYYEHKKR